VREPDRDAVHVEAERAAAGGERLHQGRPAPAERVEHPGGREREFAHQEAHQMRMGARRIGVEAVREGIVEAVASAVRGAPRPLEERRERGLAARRHRSAELREAAPFAAHGPDRCASVIHPSAVAGSTESVKCAP
jgi:hypothetical protein